MAEFTDPSWQVGTHAAARRTVPGGRFMPEGREVERKREEGREGGREGRRLAESSKSDSGTSTEKFRGKLLC